MIWCYFLSKVSTYYREYFMDEKSRELTHSFWRAISVHFETLIFKGVKFTYRVFRNVQLISSFVNSQF